MFEFLRILKHRLFPPRFTVRIRDGEALLESGIATGAFLGDCSLIAGRSGIRNGWIWGVGSGNSISLEFSRNIGKGDRQRFRNILGVHL